MFPYRVKHTESESDIQHNDLLYKIDQQCQNTFEFLENVRKSEKSNLCFVLCINSTIHIL